MDLSIKQIQYKTNKYFTKYNNSLDPIGKLVYAQKYLFYSKYNLEQTGGMEPTNSNSNSNSYTNTQEHINQMIQSINEQVVKIQSHIKKFNPIYESVEKFDEAMRTNISSEFSGYDKNEDLVEYYTNIASQCKEIL